MVSKKVLDFMFSPTAILKVNIPKRDTILIFELDHSKTFQEIYFYSAIQSDMVSLVHYTITPIMPFTYIACSAVRLFVDPWAYIIAKNMRNFKEGWLRTLNKSDAKSRQFLSFLKSCQNFTVELGPLLTFERTTQIAFQKAILDNAMDLLLTF